MGLAKTVIARRPVTHAPSTTANTGETVKWVSVSAGSGGDGIVPGKGAAGGATNSTRAIFQAQLLSSPVV